MQTHAKYQIVVDTDQYGTVLNSQSDSLDYA